jgi:hypothetical protein
MALVVVAQAAGTAETAPVPSAAQQTAGDPGPRSLQAPGPPAPGPPGGAAAIALRARGAAGRARAGRATRLGLRGVGVRRALLLLPLSRPP